MDNKYYNSERSVQILISLLKQHGIKKIIASPGTTNIPFVGSCMHDPWFEMYSNVDERGAAYMACGLAAESGEPVVISCTGATASRNYLPGLTEAFYRKLPVIAVTSTQRTDRVGHLCEQVIDRGNIPYDVALVSEYIPIVKDSEDEWSNTIKINRAILATNRKGGGPTHINLETSYSKDYSVKVIPEVRKISRICYDDSFPELPQGKKAVFIGNHKKMTEEETTVIDSFCENNNAVVLCDHTSGYKGKYRINIALYMYQDLGEKEFASIDLLIHIGEVSGAHIGFKPKQVWRVNPDGEIRDCFRKLTYVFEMKEREFFNHYFQFDAQSNTSLFHEYDDLMKDLRNRVPVNMPFSNIWVAQQTAERLPKGAALHLGILTSLRSWNFFEIPDSVYAYSNTGGFGIDGNMSTMVGGSLVCPNQIHYIVLGDLSFFYDLNASGNRHVGRNIRVLLVNNGVGAEFKIYTHAGLQCFGDDADAYIAARGHFGKQSDALIKHYAEDLGFEYLRASTKEEYLANLERFLMPKLTDKPMMFEIFTNSGDENSALHSICNLSVSLSGLLKSITRKTLGEKGVTRLKEALKK